MKKLMKKKVNIFGKGIPVFALVLVGMMAFGSAALVGYISNDVSGEVDVASPFDFQVGVMEDGSDWGTHADLEDLYGGMTTTLYTLITNNADVRIEAPKGAEITISDSEYGAVDCNEITEIVAYTMVESTETEVGRLTTGIGGLLCTEEGASIVISTDPVNLDEYESQEIYFKITTAVNMQPSEGYSFTGVVPYTVA